MRGHQQHGTGALSGRELDVCLRFGIRPEVSQAGMRWPIPEPILEGSITLLTGPSGSGKTTLLATLGRMQPGCLSVRDMPFPADVSILDAVAPTRPVDAALGILTACGLGEPRLWLRKLDQLSEGERFRARLARAVSLVERSPAGVLLCDEFCTGLHRRIAQAISFNLRKLATRRRMRFVLATARDDLEGDLSPDRIVRLARDGGVSVTTSRGRTARPTFASSLRIEEGGLQDYVDMADLHYRSNSSLGCVDSVYVLKDADTAEKLAVVVYAYPPLELALRNEATAGEFVRNPRRLNRDVRILRRLIVHPDARGCGLARWLVSQTLPRVGTRYVECLAGMGLVNPVFERAGMERIGLCRLPGKIERRLDQLHRRGLDPFSADFPPAVAREPRVRSVVVGAVGDWYRGATSGGEARAARQDVTTLVRTFRQLLGSRPVYYLWSREGGETRGAA